MKTLLKISAIVLSIISISIFVAQGQSNITLGVKGGVNFSNIYGTYTDGSPSMLTGFHLGGIVDIGINNNFSIAPELLFTRKGAEQKTTVITESGTNTITDITEQTTTLSYIEIPILAKYKLESGLHFEAGPYLSFLTGATEEGSYSHVVTGNGNANVYNTIDVSSTSGYNSTDFGFAFDAGYQFSSGLGFDLRYDLGVSDIYDPRLAYKYTNGTIGISVSYMFGKK